MVVSTATDDAEDRYDDEEVHETAADSKPEAIFTCKFPGCTRQYASTDGVRKHCRKSHPDWLREVDLEKASTGCRWAAYCTRQPPADEAADGREPAAGVTGVKRARDTMLGGGGGSLLPNPAIACAAAACSSSMGGGAASSGAPHEPKRERVAPLGLAMDGKSALRAPRAPPRSMRENAMPPDMITLPSDAVLLASAQPPGGAALTPNAHARWRLGEIADNESSALGGHAGGWPAMPGSPLCDFANAPLPKEGGFFVQWAMPPMKRAASKDALPRPASDASLNATVSASHNASEVAAGDVRSPYPDDEASSSNQNDSPATFLDSVLAL